MAEFMEVDSIDADRLVRRMKAIRAPEMRSAIAVEFLRDGEANAVVRTLGTIVRAASQHADPGYYSAADAITAALSDDTALPYDRRTALYSAATEADAPEVARLFFTGSPRPDGVNDKLMLAPERRVEPRGRVLTLGERKSLARTTRRDLIMHLVRDPHPDVIDILLENPHVTERDVATIAARRPAAPALFVKVAAHRRWRVRYPVRLTLVLNPYTPLHLAMRLCTNLRPADLRQVAVDPSLDELLRRQAGELLEPGGLGLD